MYDLNNTTGDNGDLSLTCTLLCDDISRRCLVCHSDTVKRSNLECVASRRLEMFYCQLSRC